MTEVRLGLRANAAQFSLLVLVNAFVGAMVGMERSILAPIAEREFHLAAKTAVLSFIVVFGVTKALLNLVARLRGNGAARPLLLMAHTDVVPADPAQWTVPAFTGLIISPITYSGAS